MAILAGLISVLLYGETSRGVGRPYAFVAATLFPMLPIVQQHTSSIMAELPLTLLTFATAITFTRLIDRPTSGRAFYFGLFLCSAIYLKGNGWALMALPVIALFVTQSMSSLLKKQFWIPLTCVVACCLPLAWATMQMTTDGWAEQSPSISFFMRALPTMSGFHATIIGVPLLFLACAGMFIKIVDPLWKGKPVQNLWATNFALIVSVLIFHTVVPTSTEPRKIFMSIPSLLIFAAAGIEGWVELQRRRGWIGKLSSATPFIFGALIAALCLVQPYRSIHANMGPVAQRLLDEKPLDRSAILVASTEMDERAELSFVAEIADREGGDYGHAVIRAGKFIADSSWLGLDYKLRYANKAQVISAMRSIPVSAIVLYARDGRVQTCALPICVLTWRGLVHRKSGCGCRVFRARGK